MAKQASTTSSSLPLKGVGGSSSPFKGELERVGRGSTWLALELILVTVACWWAFDPVLVTGTVIGMRPGYDIDRIVKLNVASTVTRDSNLVTMLVTSDTYMAYAAHGLYMIDYVVMDLDTKKIVHLNDLVDTAQLGEVIVRAIEDLEVNKDTRDCMFEEYRTAGRVIVPDNFFIDSTRSVINVVFQQYDITPYACGIQTVSLPIFWLSKHIPLTPYCKELFGPGCSLD